MIKQTLCFTNPAYLSLKLDQLVIRLSDESGEERTLTRPIEDIGLIMIESRQVTVTSALLSRLAERNVAVAVCDERHMPSALLMPMSGNTIMTERMRAQLESSLPLRKQLWQQTVMAKVDNQRSVLDLTSGAETGCMAKWVSQVLSGDSTNIEARAAVYYWRNLFPPALGFSRNQEAEDGVNSLLNYGYAILRAIIARSLIGSGLNPAIGIFHRNRYNPYCLADDVMEPYRPLVDRLVYELHARHGCGLSLTPAIKRELLRIPVIDVKIGAVSRPLMIAATMTTASLARCFSGESRKVIYPRLIK